MHTRLHLCRHGEVFGDRKRRYNGHRDVDITEVGVRQMHRLKDILKEADLSAVYSSDLIRSVKGADIICEGHDAVKLILPELRERNVGLWEGMSFDEIEAAYPAEWKAWLNDIVNYAPPGGESLLDVSKRVLPALKALLKENRGREVALVGHGGVNRIIISHALGLELKYVFRIEQAYGAYNIIDFYEDGIPVIKILNG